MGKPRTAGRIGGAHARRRGISLVEVMIAMTLVVVALVGLSRSIVTSSVATQEDSSVLDAAAAAKGAMETLQAAEFSQVFALYNDDPTDDPGGVGTAPGADYPVEGLTALADDGDGLPLRITFPTNPVGTELREDADLPRLGMPRDLNGDGAVDAIDHTDDYQLLPVLVEVDWTGASGPSHVEFKTLLGGNQ